VDVILLPSILNSGKKINITGSKSETNRMLLLQALYPEITLENTSNSDDSEIMAKALKSGTTLIDIHHAGTAMRFLTAYFAIREGKTITLTGSDRMKERPIKILVDALRELGAEIEYAENEGFPPIKITGKKITKNKVTLKADVSSQYISALLLIAPKLENGLELTLEGDITSIPYIKMTLALLNEIGIETSFEGNKISVSPAFKNYNCAASSLSPGLKFIIESDWSSASYFYSIIALSNEGAQITLSNYKKNSFQGDSNLSEIYKLFGVETTFIEDQITIKKSGVSQSPINLDLNKTPDIAQTIAVTCFALGLECKLSGLHTLKIKETDRLEALKTELTKLSANVSITNDSLTLEASNQISTGIKIATYNDHRMAMAFAPLALRVPIHIENGEVVSKSYPDFWKDLKQIGFKIT
jgi:3-phosphoshikimate 1-carboxyvinyltransferase